MENGYEKRGYLLDDFRLFAGLVVNEQFSRKSICNQYFIILHMIRLIGYMVYLHLIIKISNRFKKNEMVLGMCIISMIIPIALHVAGISILDMLLLLMMILEAQAEITVLCHLTL